MSLNKPIYVRSFQWYSAVYHFYLYFSFLFIFLPVLLFFYFLLAKTQNQKNRILLAFSLLFYGWGGFQLLPLVLLSIGVNHIFGHLVAPGRSNRKQMLSIAVGLNLLLLFVFKYLGFTTELLAQVIPSLIPTQTVLPIGISFYTFQGISYILDVYRGQALPEQYIKNTALYITLFPQLVAGPIIRYKTVAAEIHERHESIENAAEGAMRFAFGLSKKILIANQVGLLADSAFAQSPSYISTGTAWLGVIAYSLQIYFDFSGYSDMAIGLGQIFGFHFPENFNYPYISKSITEFWRRWHISLGAWFRDYVYIPLGGNKCSPLVHFRNILIVWLLTGIWHGANWTFLLWGLYYAVLLAGEKFLWGALLQKLPSILQHASALMEILLGWVIFRADGITQIGNLFSVLFGFAPNNLWDCQATYLWLQYRWELLLACVLSAPIVPAVKSALQKTGKLGTLILVWGRPLFALLFVLLSIIRLVSSGFNPFIYFQF